MTANGQLPSEDFTALDWIGFVVAALGLVGLLVAPFAIGPAFGEMFREFGAALPFVTRLALQSWFAPTLALLPAAALIGTVARLGSLPVRRGLVVAAFVLCLAGWGFYLYALYAPIFALAEAVAAAGPLPPIAFVGSEGGRPFARVRSRREPSRCV